jgi:tRNA-modifying protein YgfZ
MPMTIAPNLPTVSTSPALLTSRAVLRLSGRDCRTWLQGLVTSDVETLEPQQARFAALLTPQGKIIADFIVVRDGDSLLLDCDQAIAPTLAKRLAIYKLRADVAIADVSSQLGVAVFWNGEPPAVSQGVVFSDPRDAALGWRMIAPPAELDTFGADPESADAWHAHRIALGVGEGGVDFPYGDTFPHEANMDLLHGVDFKKGCYVGQEVVSRVEHRGNARKRIAKVLYDGAAPSAGTEIVANGVTIGVAGSHAGATGLALLRIDKADDALAAGHTMSANGVSLRRA